MAVRSLDSVLNYPDAISQVRATDDAVFWLASIAAQDGRVTVRRLRDGAVEDLTPDANVRSHAMEYGGGAYAVAADLLAFCDDTTGKVMVRDTFGTRPITIDQRRFVYGGLELVPSEGLVLAVREDHHAQPEARTEIVALDLDGDNPSGGRVIATGADFYAAITVLDGQVAWMQWDHPNMSWDTSSVWTATLADPSDAAPVYTRDDVSAKDPLWVAPDNLAFVADDSGFWNWRIDGGARWRTDLDCAAPTWVLNPPAAAVLPGGRIASLILDDGLGTVGIWNPATGEVASPLPGTTYVESLAVSGEDLLVVAEWADRAATLHRISADGTVTQLAGPTDPEADVTVPAALWCDGEAGPVHSWLYSPAGAAPAPLIVMTHGGPTSMATASFDATVQFWVSRGFGVLDVNYSGSTGFGRAYRDRLKGNWGIYDVSDATAAVAEVVSRGLADPARVAITGGSAGGYTTLRALTSTDVFSAGVSRYGIGDLTTLVTDTHKAESRYPHSLIAPWPEGRAVYEDRSPINHLDRLRTPMLILQGTIDKVVPPNQAVAMADAVRAAHLPVALVLLEGEGHGFRAMATRRLALEAQVSFLEQVFGLPQSPDVPVLPIENL